MGNTPSNPLTLEYHTDLYAGTYMYIIVQTLLGVVLILLNYQQIIL